MSVKIMGPVIKIRIIGADIISHLRGGAICYGVGVAQTCRCSVQT